jgi:N-6 DNA Methylase
MRPRQELAAAFRAGAGREELRPPDWLRLVQVEASVDAPATVSGPHDLGPLHERLVSSEERMRRGAWYTPGHLAAELVARAVPDRAAAGLGPVVDPACGGGVFLLAATERLVALGLGPSEAAASVRGWDVDETAVAVSEAALWWWAARHGASVRPEVQVGDALLSDLGPVGTVVGNPPFLGQLRAATTVSAERRAALRARHGDAVQAYTDPAWLFALTAVAQVPPGGHVALVQPQSFLAARDAGAVRDGIDARADLLHTVVDDGASFDANVRVCAPILRRRPADRPSEANDWVGALADAAGIPAVTVTSAHRLGDLAAVHAGFRDEYYGLVEAVSEAAPDDTRPRLVTAGGIDPFRLLDRGERFAGRRWAAPVVDLGRITGDRTVRWAELQAAPKVLVATQTRVLEAVGDPDGALLGSVPVLCVRPHDPGLLWHVLAALHAPAVTAWLFRRSAGTALSADACRPTVALLTALPVPGDGPEWDCAAEAARAASAGQGSVGDVARLADAALGVEDPRLLAWWDARRPHR